LDDVINQTVTRILDQFSIDVDLFERWSDEQLKRYPEAGETPETKETSSARLAKRHTLGSDYPPTRARRQPGKKPR
jgi:hypothetical protein